MIANASPDRTLSRRSMPRIHRANRSKLAVVFTADWLHRYRYFAKLQDNSSYNHIYAYIPFLKIFMYLKNIK